MARAAEGAAASCYLTGGGALEICRDGAEAEGVYVLPRGCEFVRNVQIVRLAPGQAAGPIQVVAQAESPVEARRGREACADRRALDPTDGGSVRSGRSPEQLALTLPPTTYRLWETVREAPRPERRRRGREAEPAPVPLLDQEGIGARNPILVAGRDWAGEEYHYVFLLATTGVEGRNRRVQIQARTYDFEQFEIRSRSDGYGMRWVPFAGAEGRRGRKEAAAPTAVLDENGKALTSHCSGEGFDTDGLNGSISVVDRTYHYFYTDTVPEDCGAAPARRRTALYLRTSQDLNAERVWSAPRTVLGPLPAGSFARVAKAKGMERWVLSYTCRRPANAPGGPVPDLCLHYTTDLGIEAITALKPYAEPVEAQRSPAYLGLRAGGDGSGRYGRAGHFWMTDRYGNLDTPANYPGKAGLLTWIDRLAPRADGSAASTLYGRPVYWATWSVRPVGAK